MGMQGLRVASQRTGVASNGGGGGGGGGGAWQTSVHPSHINDAFRDRLPVCHKKEAIPDTSCLLYYYKQGTRTVSGICGNISTISGCYIQSSRVQNPRGLKVMVSGGSYSPSGGVWIRNIVYREVFENHLGNIYPSTEDTTDLSQWIGH